MPPLDHRREVQRSAAGSSLAPRTERVYSVGVDLSDKLAILADAAKYDASCASSGAKRARPTDGFGNTTGMGICHSYTPDGRCVSLLKILFTNRCIFDCAYCINRVSSNTPRAAFTVDEVVRLTVGFYRRNTIEGLFLSSGIIKSPDHTMEQLTEVARRLRQDERFGGYIHLKAVAGASPAVLALAAHVADRLSANIELPTQTDLDQLAPAKSIEETEGTMTELHGLERVGKQAKALGGRARPRRVLPAGQSTQMVVGATPASDRSVLETSHRLYTQHRLRRVYYTAYSPSAQPHAALPTKPGGLLREHRLYQADWLLRFYGFSVAEIVAKGQNLALDKDPKLAWALANRAQFPVDVNRAPKSMLLRVPGIGTRNASRILALRRQRTVTVDDLRHLRVGLKKALVFLDVPGDRRSVRHLDAAALEDSLVPRQLDLFAVASSAASGQV